MHSWHTSVPFLSTRTSHLWNFFFIFLKSFFKRLADVEDILQKSSFYLSPCSTYNVITDMLQFIVKLFLYDFLVLKCFVVDGGLGVDRSFLSFLIVNSTKVPRELLFNVSTLWQLVGWVNFLGICINHVFSRVFHTSQRELKCRGSGFSGARIILF